MPKTEEQRRKARAATKRWRDKNKEHRAAYEKEYRNRPENKQRHAARQKAWAKANPEERRRRHAEWRAKSRPHLRQKSREGHFRFQYGMTIEERNALIVAQSGLCAICFTDDPRSNRGWHIDHCHQTGKVRGVLCRPCNQALGLARDDPRILTRMAQYLRGEL